MKTITRESTAWQYLANKLDAQGKMSLYVSWFYARGYSRCQGLCAEIDTLGNTFVISREVEDKMTDRINDMREDIDAPEFVAYLWPEGHVAPRIIAAQLLALLAKQEERREARTITATLPEDRITA